VELDEIELHDGLIKNMIFDYIARLIVIEVEYYKKHGDKKRYKGKILFEGVNFATQICDFAVMEKNAFAGNINHWTPAVDEGKTYIYLVDGCISIESTKVLFESDK